MLPGIFRLGLARGAENLFSAAVGEIFSRGNAPIAGYTNMKAEIEIENRNKLEFTTSRSLSVKMACASFT